MTRCELCDNYNQTALVTPTMGFCTRMVINGPPEWCPKGMKNSLSVILRKCQFEVLTPELVERIESEILKIFSIKQEGEKI